MRIIALRTIKEFIESRPEYADAREASLAWYRQVLRADWASPADVKREIRNASVLKDGRVVFNVAGNKYRIVVWIDLPPLDDTTGKLVESVSEGGSGHEEEAVYRAADHRFFEGSRGRRAGEGFVS